MTTETQEAQETQAAVDNWSSVDRALGRLDGQNQVLMQNVQEQTRQSQENYRALDAKIAAQGHQSREDYRALDAKIDGVKSELEAKIDAQGRQSREDYRALDAKIDAQNQVIREQGQQSREDYRALDAKIDTAKSDLDAKIAGLHSEVSRLLYWVLGVAGVIIATIIGAAFSVILLS